MIRISNIKIPIERAHQKKDAVKDKIAILIKTSDFILERIVKCSIDARDKNNLLYIYSVDISTPLEKKLLNRNRNNNNIMLTPDENYIFPYKSTQCKKMSPVIIGAGPAGYFCGLYLARAGYRPVIFERGKPVQDRTVDVDNFWKGNSINPESNVSFGEGGAGTFSDGKLNTGIKDKNHRIKAFIEDFISFGASEDIAYLSKPHVGTDQLKKILVNIRNEIISLGGEIHFSSRFDNYTVNKDNTINITINHKGEKCTYCTNALVLAIGHSARDTFRMLYDSGIPMDSKAFAMGVRIEHPRSLIDAAQYGTGEAALSLPASDYKLTYHAGNGRGVYSFCMCPGGFVVNAASDKNQAVVNGMSNHSRDEDNSNSAIVVTVTPEDFEKEGCGNDSLAGVRFQEKYEQMAYVEGKGNIPVQLFGDYIDNKPTTKLGNIVPNIKGRYTLGNLNNCLPQYINSAIIEGISYFDKKLKGFAGKDSVLSGIESRTSSPVRITRNDNFMSKIVGIFPCGEGAGYAGGITSAAVDGIKTAEAVAYYINSL